MNYDCIHAIFLNIHTGFMKPTFIETLYSSLLSPGLIRLGDVSFTMDQTTSLRLGNGRDLTVQAMVTLLSPGIARNVSGHSITGLAENTTENTFFKNVFYKY